MRAKNKMRAAEELIKKDEIYLTFNANKKETEPVYKSYSSI